MSSRFERGACGALAGACLWLAACEREARHFQDVPPGGAERTIALSELHPGLSAPPPRAHLDYEENAFAISEGQRLFRWFNCNGCHFNGGGGIGPALMDAKWIYGSDPVNIYATIMEGRPNGMPSFRGRIPSQQAWQIVAYVRSLSGLEPKSVEPGRPDHLNVRQPPQSTRPTEPRDSK